MAVEPQTALPIIEIIGVDQADILSADAYEEGRITSVWSAADDTPVLMEVG